MTKAIEPIYKLTGLKIATLRELLGVTQADLAKKVGYSRPALVNIEKGKQRLTLHVIQEISLALGTTPKALLRGVWF